MSTPPFDVLHEDNHLLVVNKPAGVLSQGDRTGDADLLTLGKAYLKAKYHKPGAVYLGLVHRLDRPTSGVMVLARTSKAARRLSEQFRRRTPMKRYLALVEGTMAGRGHAVDYLQKRGRQVRRVDPETPGAQRAELWWRALATHRGTTLVDVKLKTGRTHQIRVQLAHRGHPLLGDPRYGATQEIDGQALGLHCYHLTIEHPTQRVPVVCQAPPPDVWGHPFQAEVAALLAAYAVNSEE
ncbi:MAG: RNA pseudouridine synthase [Bacteroidota bacterium]